MDVRVHQGAWDTGVRNPGLLPREVSQVMGILSLRIPAMKICSPAAHRRILKPDHSGRSLRVLPFRRPIGVRRVSVLSELGVGQTGVVVNLNLPESVQNHLMHMGFVPEARVTALRRAPAGDPTVYAVDGMEIALRHETASAIRVREPGAALAPAQPEAEKLPSPAEVAEVAAQ